MKPWQAGMLSLALSPLCFSLLLLAVLLSPLVARAQTNEYRAFWVDSWGAGFRSAAEVNTLTNDLRRAKMNAVFPQVRRRGDAFYNSNYEPKNSFVSPSFDPLADLITKAHNTNAGQRIEVHAWIVTYHVWQTNSSTPGLPSNPNHPVNLHPDWLLEDVNGNIIIDNEYTFDPGHPEVQRHTYNVCMDIVNNYDVDGLNFDYVRYSSINVGYNPVTVARFNQRFGRTGQPSPSDAAWKQFRRDQVTSLVRKVYLNAIAVKPNIKISADTITWSPGPTSLASWYSSSAAWNTVLQDWRGWMEEGIIDLNLPMAYFDQAGAYTLAWTNWNNFTKDHQYNRHAVIGPGIYLNSVANAIAQMRFTRTGSPGGNFARGNIGYSYRVTNKDGVARSTFINALVNPSAYDPITPPINSQLATVPTMPWKTAPTNGHLKGTIYYSHLTNGLDGAVVTLTGPVNRVQTNDATGFYGFVDLPPGAYTVQASFPGYVAASTNVTVSAGVVATRDLPMVLSGPPAIVAQPMSLTNYVGTPATFTVSVSGASPFAYQWRKGGTNLAGATNLSYSLGSVAQADAGDYTVIITNSFGATTSVVATLTVDVLIAGPRAVPLWNIPTGTRAYIANDSLHRGLTFNPANGHLLVLSRTSSNTVYVLNSTNGADLYVLNNGAGIISGGTFVMNMIGAADDGAIYVGNLVTDASVSAFKLYRWANDNPGTTPTVAYSGTLGASTNRWGDTLDVRGAGTNTQVLIGSRWGTNAIIFTTANGTSFTPTAINVNTNDGGLLGLGIAFGSGDTFWGKSSSKPLRQIAFNLGTGVGTVLQTFTSPTVPNAVAPIGISTNLGMLGGVAIDTPDNFQLYDLPVSGAPELFASTNFPSDNANGNATGAVDFGGNRVFALDSNNGILAMEILPSATAPVIVTNPAGLTLIEGNNAQFDVSVTGSEPLVYQWRLNGVNLPGANAATLTVFNVLESDAGQYTVVVTNVAGSVTSAPALLTVLVPPDITEDPQNLTVNVGQSAQFNVTVDGTAPLLYQWRFEGAPLSGATNQSLTLNNAQVSNAGTYSVVVSNAAGAAASGDAELVVQTLPALLTQPVPQVVKVGSNVTFTATADGIPAPVWQWLFNNAPIGGANLPTLTLTNVQTNAAGNYSVIISNAVGAVTSSNALLTVQLPVPLVMNSIVRLPDGRVQLGVSGEPGMSLWLDGANVLPVWQAITNLTNPGGSLQFIDDDATNQPRRFYRARY